MTQDLEIRYVSLSMYHRTTHAARGRYLVTLCGQDLTDKHVERMIDRATCSHCLGILNANHQAVPA